MRGNDQQNTTMFSYISPEERVPEDHPLRPIRSMVDKALKDLSPLFEGLYSPTGPSGESAGQAVARIVAASALHSA